MASQVEPEFLRVWRVQSFGAERSSSDFRILGLRKVRGPRIAGRKAWTRYYHGADLAVQVVFSDVREGGNLTGVSAIFTWYREDGAVGETETKMVEHFRPREREGEARKRREQAIQDVFDNAGTPSDVSDALSFYMQELARFEKFGVLRLRQAMNTETDPDALTALNKEYSVGETIKGALLAAMGL